MQDVRRNVLLSPVFMRPNPHVKVTGSNPVINPCDLPHIQSDQSDIRGTSQSKTMSWVSTHVLVSNQLDIYDKPM